MCMTVHALGCGYDSSEFGCEDALCTGERQGWTLDIAVPNARAEQTLSVLGQTAKPCNKEMQ